MPASDDVFNRVPVIFILKGNKTNSDNSVENFEYCYEFSRFRSSITISNSFQV